MIFIISIIIVFLLSLALSLILYAKKDYGTRRTFIFPSVDEEGDDFIYQMKLKKIEVPAFKGKLSQADCMVALRTNFFGDAKYMQYQEAKSDIIIEELDKRSKLYDVYKRVQQAQVSRRKK